MKAKELEKRIEELEGTQIILKAENERLKNSVVMAGGGNGRDFLKAEKKQALTDADLKLINEACEVYGVDKKHLFASRIDRETGEAVIATNGGKKIRHRQGDPARVELKEVDITGILPKEEMIWDKKLNQRVPVKNRSK